MTARPGKTARPAASRTVRPSAGCPGVVPPYLLQRLASAPAERSARLDTAPSVAERTLALDAELRLRRDGVRTGAAAGSPGAVAGRLQRTVADAKGTQTLPGDVVRREGEPAVGDPAADESYDGLGVTYALFDEVYGWSSLDGRGLPLDATVHYGEQYDNAFWDGSRMVFGDGDGEVFTRFTVSLSVIAHELAHGFTQYTSQLEYSGQSGALNESISDVFGVLAEQRARNENAEDSSWLVGEGLFLPDVRGSALRSMLRPGTAYDDDVLGRDPQPADMAGYVETTEDNGGVHINSGIPNRAFAEAAVALRGPAWDRLGQVWFDTCTGGTLTPTADFSAFAAATVAAATTRYGAGSDVHRAVLQGWTTVGLGQGLEQGGSDAPDEVSRRT
ncbi:M4 family metallopeptidase [Rhodococcoides kroppenstedtii]|uniref:M4 family metallopeptidase n=1 Tax=Rhodococcoides kroppenstedtii TaxID=293050 RepID=UPI0028E9F932|nr:M4 family metallopeptidase [Rhodococcus kroppenstedtii]